MFSSFFLIVSSHALVVVVAQESVSKCHPADHDVTIVNEAVVVVAAAVEEAAAVAVAAEIGTGTF